MLAKGTPAIPDILAVLDWFRWKLRLLLTGLATCSYVGIVAVLTDDLPWNRKMLGAAFTVAIAGALTIAVVRIRRRPVDR